MNTGYILYVFVVEGNETATPKEHKNRVIRAGFNKLRNELPFKNCLIIWDKESENDLS